MNKTVSDEIMSSIRDALSASNFQFSAENAKIITGKDEGSFGWITVNYLKKVLQETHKVANSLFGCTLFLSKPFASSENAVFFCFFF